MVGKGYGRWGYGGGGGGGEEVRGRECGRDEGVGSRFDALGVVGG